MNKSEKACIKLKISLNVVSSIMQKYNPSAKRSNVRFEEEFLHESI